MILFPGVEFGEMIGKMLPNSQHDERKERLKIHTIHRKVTYAGKQEIECKSGIGPFLYPARDLRYHQR